MANIVFFYAVCSTRCYCPSYWVKEPSKLNPCRVGKQHITPLTLIHSRFICRREQIQLWPKQRLGGLPSPSLTPQNGGQQLTLTLREKTWPPDLRVLLTQTVVVSSAKWPWKVLRYAAVGSQSLVDWKVGWWRHCRGIISFSFGRTVGIFSWWVHYSATHWCTNPRHNVHFYKGIKGGEITRRRWWFSH